MSTSRSKIDPSNKLPLQSKKFVAYLISDIGWKIVIAALLLKVEKSYDQYTFLLMLTLIIINGFIQVGYILGEIALDRYTRIAEAGLMDRRRNHAKPVQPPEKPTDAQ
jgi:hypothetical protein